MTVFGPSFFEDLKAAGLNDLHIAWHPDTGDMVGWDELDESFQDSLAEVIGGHDPTMPASPQTPISMRQFWLALALPPYEMIKDKEAIDAVKRAALPQFFGKILKDIEDPKTRLLVESKLYGANEIRYDDEIIPLLAAEAGWSRRQSIEFFLHAASV